VHTAEAASWSFVYQVSISVIYHSVDSVALLGLGDTVAACWLLLVPNEQRPAVTSAYIQVKASHSVS
jgi:hypothetical protein